jgi:molybdopterin-guanine dinucleotide biosynthesis protein A
MEAHHSREGPRRSLARGGSRAGFVLTGGRSSRMGRDKAALPWGGATLVEYVAACVRAAASQVTLVGAPERYAHLGLPAIADRYQDCGPLGGICTALESTGADWNLIVACDMPGVTADFLSGLFEAAETADVDCLIPESDGLHPLCAVYHRRAGPVAKRQILSKSFKMHDFVASLQALTLPAPAASVENINTPQDWTSR